MKGSVNQVWRVLIDLGETFEVRYQLRRLPLTLLRHRPALLVILGQRAEDPDSANLARLPASLFRRTTPANIEPTGTSATGPRMTIYSALIDHLGHQRCPSSVTSRHLLPASGGAKGKASGYQSSIHAAFGGCILIDK
jgi:hypothetical protein